MFILFYRWSSSPSLPLSPRALMCRWAGLNDFLGPKIYANPTSCTDNTLSKRQVLYYKVTAESIYAQIVTARVSIPNLLIILLLFIFAELAKWLTWYIILPLKNVGNTRLAPFIIFLFFFTVKLIKL